MSGDPTLHELTRELRAYLLLLERAGLRQVAPGDLAFAAAKIEESAPRAEKREPTARAATPHATATTPHAARESKSSAPPKAALESEAAQKADAASQAKALPEEKAAPVAPKPIPAPPPPRGGPTPDPVDDEELARLATPPAKKPASRSEAAEESEEPAASAAPPANDEPPVDPNQLDIFAMPMEPAPKREKTASPEPAKPAPLSRSERVAALDAIAQEVAICRACKLCETRTNTVPGEGNPEARLMFIGEGPGAREDELGRPFVGRSGELLDKMIAAMGLSRESVFIGNVVKCRPPGNRDPEPDERGACEHFLRRQVEILRPEAICLLGRVAAQLMLNTKISTTKLRGQWHLVMGIPALVTYHPAYLLRSPSYKAQAWEDLQAVMKRLGLKAPERGKS